MTVLEQEVNLILSETAERLKKTGKYEVYTNPGQEHNVAVGSFYPDIILTAKGSKAVRFIIEVSTSSSIQESQLSRWREIAQLNGAIFYLLVPHSSLAIAKQLCAKAHVPARFAYYEQDEQGNIIKITYEN